MTTLEEIEAVLKSALSTPPKEKFKYKNPTKVEPNQKWKLVKR